jgi:hypothetical protein
MDNSEPRKTVQFPECNLVFVGLPNSNTHYGCDYT